MSLVETHPAIAREAGPLLPFLLDPQIREIRCTSAGRVFTIHSEHGKQRQADYDPQLLDGFLMLIADHVGTEWRTSSPRLHAADPRLGFRIQAARPPISEGTWMVCRKHPQVVFPLEDFEAKGILTPQQRRILEESVQQRQTILISGEVGSSKTSLLNAVLNTLKDSKERIILLEDDPELHCQALEVETMRTTDHPLVTMRDLGKDLLRMSGDRIVVGEVRDGAALDMLKAFHCGTPGLGTIHADSAPQTLQRLEQLIQEVSVDPQRELIGEAIDRIIHMERYGLLWRATALIHVERYDGAKYIVRQLA